MTSMLFFRGQGSTAARAIARAGAECAALLQENPCLMVELVELNQTGQTWNAHLRVMAMEGVSTSGGQGRPPQKNYDPKNPEHAKSGDPNNWRPTGMAHDPSSLNAVEAKFDTASMAGQVPDVPVKDIVMLRQSGMSEDQILALRNLYIAKPFEKPEPK